MIEINKHPSTIYATKFRIYNTHYETILEFYYQPPIVDEKNPPEPVPLVAVCLNKNDGRDFLAQLNIAIKSGDNKFSGSS